MGKLYLVALRWALSIFFFTSIVVVKLELDQLVVKCFLDTTLLNKLLPVLLVVSRDADPLTEVKAELGCVDLGELLH